MSHPLCCRHRTLTLILLSLLVLFGLPRMAKTQVELVAHPNQDTTRNNSAASTFYEFQGKVYFKAFDHMGYALYSTDGTPAGTACITRDITPLAFTSCGDWLYIYGSKPQYASGYDIPWGKYAIWRMKADGTERHKLVDLFLPYSMYSYEVFLWPSSDRIFYSWRGGLSWIDNNSGNVTEYYQGLHDFSSHLDDYSMQKVAMAPNGLFFIGRGESKENFFFTNLIDHTTVHLANIKIQGESPPFDNMRIYNNKCYVLHVADSSQLWESDGTLNGTRIVWQDKTTFPKGVGNPFFSSFLEFQGKLIFDVPVSNGNEDWHAIYSFDGSKVDLLQNHPGHWQNISMVKSPDALFVFVTTNYDTGTNEIWKMDSSGYSQVGTAKFRNTYRRDALWRDHLLIFPATDSLLLLDDQTLECTYSKPMACNTLHPTSLGIFFNQYDNGYIRDHYVLNTSPPDCNLILNSNGSQLNGDIEELFPHGERLFFRANSSLTGKELWATDGNPENTRLVKEINTAAGNNSLRGTNPTAFAQFGNRLIFTASGLSESYMNQQDFTGLWITDGTENGTSKLENLMINEAYPDNVKVVFRDSIWFIGKGKTNDENRKLWVSDGNPGGARIFDQDGQGATFNRPYGLTVAGNLLYFFAYSSGGSVRLWATDGSVEGTRCINDIIGDQGLNFGLYYVPQILASNGKLYFTGDRWVENEGNTYLAPREVWVTDGTKSGSHALADFGETFTKTLYIKFLGSHKGNLVFTYPTAQDGLELWYSGGDRATTRRLTGHGDDQPNPDKSFSKIVSLGDHFFFTGFTEENGLELWISDGTPNGTQIFLELSHGQKSTRPHNLTIIGDKMIFFCSPDGAGQSMWVTDGTLEGTEPLPWNDTLLSNFREVRFWNHALYFVACHPETGDGLYRYQLPGTLGIEPLFTLDSPSEFRVYPNPSEDFIQIDLGADNHFPLTFKLISSTGSLIKEFTVTNNHALLPISELPSGLYVIRQGESWQTFIKQ
jgi:ELWxxDGT repeat protein